MLRVRSLRAGYGAVEILRDVSIEVGPRQIVALIGPNGAGKSTLLRSISGLIRITTGQVVVDGQDVTGRAPEKLVQHGVIHVPEGRKLFAPLTVLENLIIGTYGSRTRRDPRRRKQALDFVFNLFPVLEQRREQLAGTLSGGEQQMLAIGRALMAEPRILLLDEPSLGLAPLIVDQIFTVLETLNRQKGIAMLLVEQNALKALHVSERAYVMEVGRIVLEGPSRQLSRDARVRRIYLGELGLDELPEGQSQASDSRT